MRSLRTMKQLQVSVMALALVVALGFAAMPSTQAQTFKTLYEFSGGADGFSPNAGVTAVVSPGGTITLYGTTYFGGNLNCNPPLGCGITFKLSLSGKETVLNRFAGGNDGAFPYSAPIIDAKGNVYGTTSAGGGASGCLGSGCGTAYEIPPKLREKALYRFKGELDGGMPFTGLTPDKAGNFFGTTTFGGDLSCGVAPPGCGTFFEIDPSGKITVKHRFHGKPDGALPQGGSVVDDPLWFFIAPKEGGNLACNPPNGCGEVVRDNKSTGKLEILHTFNGADGELPYSGVTLNGGFVYGTTFLGGANNKGVLFKLDPKKKTFQIVHSFGSGQDGATPGGGVAFDSQGNMYGTTESGGKSGEGTLFKIDSKGNESVLHDFSFVDGAIPLGSLTFVPKCNCLFGTTSQSSPGEGTVWQFIL